MQHLQQKLILVALAAALAAPIARADDAPAQPCPCGQGQGPGRGGWHGRGRGFDVKAVTTVQGKIQSVDAFQGRRGHGGVHLTLAVGAENLQVRVGPQAYVDAQTVKLAAGDTIEVKGARLERGDRVVLVAQEIRKDGQVLALRDAQGAPLWAPGGQAPAR